MLRRPAALLLIAVLSVAACGGGTAPASPAPATPAAATPAPGATVAATIVDFAFNPPELTVAPGTTVVWTNSGKAPHTVTASDGSFKSDGTLASGATFTHTFDAAGTFAYTCLVHASMKATVVVAP